jgi:D-glycero-D-manno-heptose 1,7-bisphosphate phosphatase
MANAAIFLDRDDTIIEDPGYINDPEQVKLLPAATDALSQLKKMGYKLVVVTNQSAVARGMVSEEVLEEIHERLRKLLGRKHVYLDGIYYCPYHPEAVIPKYRRDSDFRKPNPGMLFQAAEEMDLDLKESWMIGNTYSDVAAGVNAGCRTILIRSSLNPPTKGPADPNPDKIAVNIKEAVNIIKMFRQQSMMTPKPSLTPSADETPPEAAEEPAAVAASSEPPAERNAEDEDDRQPDAMTKAPAARKRLKLAVKRSITPDRREPEPRETVVAEAPEPEPDARSEEPAAPPPHRPIQTSQAPSTSSGRRFMQPRVGGPPGRTSTPPERPSPADASDTQDVLSEVMRYLKKADRLNMYDEFSWLKVMAGVLQVVVLFFLLLSLWFLMDPTRDASAVHTVLGYAVVLQLMAIAFHLMRDRR